MLQADPSSEITTAAKLVAHFKLPAWTLSALYFIICEETQNLSFSKRIYHNKYPHNHLNPAAYEDKIVCGCVCRLTFYSPGD